LRVGSSGTNSRLYNLRTEGKGHFMGVSIVLEQQE